MTRQMQPATLDKMLSALDEYEARSVEQVAASTGDSRRTTYVKLHLMHENGWVWREPLATTRAAWWSTTRTASSAWRA